MDAVVVLKTIARMCNSYERCSAGCPLNGICVCRGRDEAQPELIIAAVEKWRKEHPVKTRQSEFQKHYPNVTLSHGIIYLCPKWVDENARVNCLEKECRDCREQYWLEEIE